MTEPKHENLDERFPRPPRSSPRVTGAAAKQHYGSTSGLCGATVGSFTLYAPAVNCGACKRELRAAKQVQ
jgi:hypothetical protein